MYSKILVPLDGSKTAEKVLPYARYLAGKFKVPVELLAVVDIAEVASHMASEKARFLDTIIEDGVRAQHKLSQGRCDNVCGHGCEMLGGKGQSRRHDHRKSGNR